MLKKSKQMTFKIDSSMEQKLASLSLLLNRHPGTTGIELELALPDMEKTVTLNVTEPVGVSPTSEFFEGLHGLFGRTDFVEIRG
jgi:DNA polymerase-3 subunit alpha